MTQIARLGYCEHRSSGGSSRIHTGLHGFNSDVQLNEPHGRRKLRAPIWLSVELVASR
jgi:hypothetical protein